MHELSLAHSILSIAENAVPENSKAFVTSVGLQIGELSGIEIESLEFAFSVIKADTLLQNAELDIQIIKGEAECSECKTIFSLSSYGTCCPQCKSYSMKILNGREMRVLNIVVDE
jgi:hydrogenase nickel incorporation protein HypA/HybF